MPRYKLRTLLVVLALGPLLVAAPFACPHVDSETTNHIQKGMTRVEVETIAGSPFSRYESGDGEVWEYLPAEFWPTAFLNPYCVRFDSKGRVESSWVH